MKMIFLSQFLIFTIFFLISTLSQAMEYPESDLFRRNRNNSIQDNFCPRLEGSYPKNCCPYIQKAPISCYYYDPTTVLIGTNSQATTCAGGVDQTVSCCNRSSRACIKNLKEKKFIQRQIRRDYNDDKNCGFEPCPFPAYWKKDTGLGTIISRQDKSNERCEVVIQPDQCASTNLPECSSLSACPVPVPDPEPSPTPTPTPTPSPEPGPSPGPSPGPTPGPEPAPAPQPEPAPAPQPEPAPAPQPEPAPAPQPEPAPAPAPEPSPPDAEGPPIG